MTKCELCGKEYNVITRNGIFLCYDCSSDCVCSRCGKQFEAGVFSRHITCASCTLVAYEEMGVARIAREMAARWRATIKPFQNIYEGQFEEVKEPKLLEGE